MSKISSRGQWLGQLSAHVHLNNRFRRLADLRSRGEKDAERLQQLTSDLQELKSREAVALKEAEDHEARCQQLLQRLSTAEHALELTKAESDVRNDKYVSLCCSTEADDVHRFRLHEANARCLVRMIGQRSPLADTEHH